MALVVILGASAAWAQVAAPLANIRTPELVYAGAPWPERIATPPLVYPPTKSRALKPLPPTTLRPALDTPPNLRSKP